jgi:hypothetical protein
MKTQALTYIWWFVGQILRETVLESAAVVFALRLRVISSNIHIVGT